MKILPFSSDSASSAALGGTSQQDLINSSLFAGMMHDMVNMQAQIPSESIKPASAPEQSRASQSHDMVIASVPASAPMTIEDVSKLRNELEKRGISRDRLDRLTELANNGESMTISKVIASLRNGTSGGPIAEGDKLQIRSLLQKLGLQEDQASAMIDDLENGKTLGAWTALLGKIKGLGSDGITIELPEAEALARAAGASAGAMDALRKSFAGADSVTLSKDGVQQLFASLQQELTKRAQQDKLLEGVLGEALNPVLQGLRSRQESETSANRLGSKSADNAEALMHDTFQKKTGGIPVPGRNEQGADADTPRFGRDQQNAHGKSYLEELLASRTEKGSTSQKSTTSRNDWDSMLQRVHLVPGSSMMAQPINTQNLHTATGGAPAQAVLDQIEKGFLSNLHDGARRIELRLDPVELGALNVMLTVRNGEVSAIIRPERAETAQLVNDHVHQLRQQLEQQGLKIERIEVQTQLPENQFSGGWQGMDQHNASRERQERTETIERIKRMSRGRNESEGLAQEMQFRDGTADTAAGLHIIA